MSIGLPVKLLHEATGHSVTVELNTGEVYRGILADAEDNMNCQLERATVTSRDGRQTTVERCYIRGSKIRFFIVPDILQNAPMFQKLDPGQIAMRGRGMGFGVAGIRRQKTGRQGLEFVGRHVLFF